MNNYKIFREKQRIFDKVIY